MRAKQLMVMVAIALCGAGMAMGQTVWEHDPDNPIIGPGPPGSWDAGGHGATTVLFDGFIYHMWITGWDGGGNNWDIGHATSPDGLPPWTMDPLNPVLIRGQPGSWDEDSIFSPAVIFDGALFHMWYSGWHNNRERVGYATSPYGSVWTKYFDNPVMDVGSPGSWDDWRVLPGTVILDGGSYRMWYSAGKLSPQSMRIGYAESLDGIDWIKGSEPVLDGSDHPGAWDESVYNPGVVFEGSAYHMWFGGGDPDTSEIGYAFSDDGVHWTKHRDNPVVQTADEYAFLAPVIFDGSTYHMWYSHGFPPGSSISYATSTCCAGLFGDGFETGDTWRWSVTVP